MSAMNCGAVHVQLLQMVQPLHYNFQMVWLLNQTMAVCDADDGPGSPLSLDDCTKFESLMLIDKVGSGLLVEYDAITSSSPNIWLFIGQMPVFAKDDMIFRIEKAVENANFDSAGMLYTDIGFSRIWCHPVIKKRTFQWWFKWWIHTNI